jgi:hypothetical protein
MEVGQGPNWGCSAKGKRILRNQKSIFTSDIYDIMNIKGSRRYVILYQCMRIASPIYHNGNELNFFFLLRKIYGPLFLFKYSILLLVLALL